MKGLEEYLLPYVIVQVISLLFLWAALRNTRVARLMFSLLFLYASIYNMKTGVTHPEVYLDYASMALPFYRRFINGWFSQYHYIMVPLIAAGQFLIGMGMLLKDWWVKWACIGTIIFLVAIIPLMTGSGFPFPIVTSIAALLVLLNDRRKYIWQARHGNASEWIGH